MKSNLNHHPPVRADCHRRRLAEGSIAAVDACTCGLMQVHLGALTLRLEPGAVCELIATLERAVQGYAAAPSPGFGTHRRGQA